MPTGEPRVHHLGVISTKKFDLLKISYDKTKWPGRSMYSGAFLKKVQKSSKF